MYAIQTSGFLRALTRWHCNSTESLFFWQILFVTSCWAAKCIELGWRTKLWRPTYALLHRGCVCRGSLTVFPVMWTMWWIALYIHPSHSILGTLLYILPLRLLPDCYVNPFRLPLTSYVVRMHPSASSIVLGHFDPLR